VPPCIIIKVNRGRKVAVVAEALCSQLSLRLLLLLGTTTTATTMSKLLFKINLANNMQNVHTLTKSKISVPKTKSLMILLFWELASSHFFTSTPTSHSPLHLPYFPQFYHLLHLTQVLPSSSSFRNVQRSSFSTFLPCCTGSRDLCTTCAERYLMTDLVPLAGYYLAGTAPRASKIHG
jgi:hypothetical protein